jgi:hypothetical protein
MKFDPALPIAVFLGPSLGRDTAQAILPANYYPPVRMGDVYRLLTCGARLIVIIDGVFHAATPVWQREIVAAIDSGIAVVGASSMGALRAAELEPFGMTGIGVIAEWYRTGFIEGDDEVALEHANEEHGFRAFSEPLVNLRWNLARAADAGVISAAERDRLIADEQPLEYGRRGYPHLFESDAFARLAPTSQGALRAFISDRGENLKQLDAESALRWCAGRLPELLQPQHPRHRRGRRVERAIAVLRRGIPTPGHELLPLEDLIVQAAADRVRTTHIVHLASRRFYVLDWARRAGVNAPDGIVDSYRREWTTRQRADDTAAWLAQNGMTADELDREIEARALEAWLLDQAPSAFGLDRPYLEAWAEMMGIEPPEGTEDAAAFRTWLVEQTPNAFGFDQWSMDLAFARELQMSGEIARLAEWRANAGAGAL